MAELVVDKLQGLVANPRLYLNDISYKLQITRRFLLSPYDP